LEQVRHSTARRVKLVLTGLVVVLMLLISALSCDSSFHQSLHSGPCHSGHGCVLCLFLHGQVDSVDTSAVQNFFFTRSIVFLPAPVNLEISGLDLRLSPTRGPPSC